VIHTDNYSLSGFAHHPINHRGEKKGGRGRREKKGRHPHNLHLQGANPLKPWSQNK